MNAASFTEMAVDRISVGARHRKDMGDIGVLAESIRRLGLLQPITVTPDGVLVCGARRLAAVKHLGWERVMVCVRPGLSPRLAALMAERDENMARKQFTTSEAATLYEEMKSEIAADAARRAQATQFAPGHAPNQHGQPAAPPQAQGDSRVQAAQLVGGPSHATLEKVVTLREIVADTYRTPQMRQTAAAGLQAIDAGEPVDRVFLPVRTAMRVEELESITSDRDESPEVRKAARQGLILMSKLQEEHQLSASELDRAAQVALDRVNLADRKAKRKPKNPRPVKPPKEKKAGMGAFGALWVIHTDWPSQFDATEVGTKLADDKWDLFTQAIQAGVRFWRQAKEARDGIVQHPAAELPEPESEGQR
ncbi:MAG: ParB N-terminal domain-containing protein [Bifidobacteriaceae bacterium]|nr:ParB N-terminal domain-containing protein [Bifidobacteriaceae bacterium]